MKVLVTGASGMVGANLVRALLRQRNTVRVLLRRDSVATALRGLPLERAVGDVLEADALKAAAMGCRVIYHCATPFTYWGAETGELNRVAVEGSRNVVAAARAAGVQRLVLTASSILFGSSERPKVRDERSVRPANEPMSPYLTAKVTQWQEIRRAARRAHIPVVAVCPTVTLGAHDHRLSPSNAILVNYLRHIPGGRQCRGGRGCRPGACPRGSDGAPGSVLRARG